MKINNARAHYVTPAKVVGSTSVLVLLALIGWMEMLREISSTITLAVLAGENNRSRSQADNNGGTQQFFSHLCRAAAKSAFDINARATPQKLFCVDRRSHYGGRPTQRPAFLFKLLADFLYSVVQREPIVLSVRPRNAHNGIFNSSQIKVVGLMSETRKVCGFQFLIGGGFENQLRCF